MFTTEFAAAAGATVHFVGVGTPQIQGGYAADMTYVNAAIDALLPHLSEGDIVAGKSTVPVGTAASLEPRVSAVGATLVISPAGRLRLGGGGGWLTTGRARATTGGWLGTGR
jgi:UDPglucose 6-dehydrogenase